MSSLAWEQFPECPDFHIDQANVSGIIKLPSGVELWHAVFGIPIEHSLKISKSPMIFMHGGFNHSGYWANQIEHFKKDNTVIVFDNRGHGRSPLGEKQFNDYDDLADDILGLLDYYHILKAVLVGWSDGAVMAWSLLARHPERIERMWANGAVDDYRRTEVEATMAIPMVQEYFVRLPQEWNALNPNGDFSEMQSKYMVMWNRSPLWTADTFKSVPIRGIDKDAPIVWIVVGDYDDWIPLEHHVRFRSYIKNSSYCEMPGTGHLAFVQTPELYNRLLQTFLEDK
jgi:pimeloyl-ACP methyl ester carboxylesterase